MVKLRKLNYIYKITQILFKRKILWKMLKNFKQIYQENSRIERNNKFWDYFKKIQINIFIKIKYNSNKKNNKEIIKKEIYCHNILLYKQY